MTEVDAGAIVEEAAEAEKASDVVMANVSDAVNVRVEPSEEAEVAGKLYKNCGGTILEQADGWTKLTSGELTGWTKDEFLLFGDEAEAMQQEVGSLKQLLKQMHFVSEKKQVKMREFIPCLHSENQLQQ